MGFELDKIFELLEVKKVEINSFITQKTAKIQRRGKRPKRYIEIRITPANRIHIFCEKYQGKVVSVFIPVSSTIREALETAYKHAHGHAEKLIRNYIEPNIDKIVEDLENHNFSLIKLKC